MRSILTITLLLFITCLSGQNVTLRSVGAKGDGKSDDSQYFIKAVKLASNKGVFVDGENLTYKLKGSFDLILKSFYIKNINIVFGTTYNNQFNFSSNTDKVNIQNVFIDGGRNTYNLGIESWKVFAKENDIQSINPDVKPVFFFQSKSNKAQFIIAKLNVKNIHAESVVTFYTFGEVNMSNLNFSNISNKTFHVYHSYDDGITAFGSTTLYNAKAVNIGQMAKKILVNSKMYITSEGHYMPQGSFNFIVSHGNFTAKDIYVENYGSTGFTSDRNFSFKGTNIKIENLSQQGFSNNPSAGFWIEASKNIKLSNLDINIQNRSALDQKFNSSALHFFGKSSNAEFNKITINSNNKVIKKGFLGEFLGENNVKVSDVRLSGDYLENALFSGTLSNDARYNFDIDNIYANQIFFYNANAVKINKLTKYSNNVENLLFYVDIPALKNMLDYKIENTNFNKIRSNYSSTRITLPKQVKLSIEK